jgi:plasmid segregation protein ParM
LVIGLPISLMGDQSLRQYLIDFLQATHLDLPRLASGKGDRSITVDRVKLIPQPAGSLLAWSADKGASGAFENEINLTIDVGFGSLQWLVTRGYSPLHEFCGSNIGGVSSLVHRMLCAIDRDAATNINIVERMGNALCQGIPTIKISGRSVELSRYRQNLETAQQEYLSELRACINRVKDIDNIILTGGGASIYADQIRAVFSGHEILMFDEDSHLGNVRGFQNYADMMGLGTGLSLSCKKQPLVHSD